MFRILRRVFKIIGRTSKARITTLKIEIKHVNGKEKNKINKSVTNEHPERYKSNLSQLFV